MCFTNPCLLFLFFENMSFSTLSFLFLFSLFFSYLSYTTKYTPPQLYFSFFSSNFVSICICNSLFFFSSIFEKCALLTPVFFFDFYRFWPISRKRRKLDPPSIVFFVFLVEFRVDLYI